MFWDREKPPITKTKEWRLTTGEGKEHVSQIFCKLVNKFGEGKGHVLFWVTDIEAATEKVVDKLNWRKKG